MKAKSLYILAIILFLLIALVGFQLYFPKFLKTPSPYHEKVKSIDPKSVTIAEITSKEKSLTIKKGENIWKINGKKGNEVKIEELINNLVTATEPQVIAQTDKKHQEFELTDDLAKKISLDGKLVFLIGKSTMDGTYVRFEKTDQVYLVKNLSSQSYSLNPDDWYDKTIVKIEEKNINKILFVKEKERFTLFKEDNKWKLEDGKKEIDTNKLSPILTSLSLLQAQKLADKETVSQYPISAVVTVAIEHLAGKETLSFFQGKNDYLLKRDSDGEHFIILEYQAKNFLIPASDLVKKD
ncbi:DUF4340 domain-containing protein [Candidatus Gottesmanbacteria bacterium]|nr:DUF4340 domain-containing protein [Candidatus Gottesmanbacteria bacterium]